MRNKTDFYNFYFERWSWTGVNKVYGVELACADRQIKAEAHLKLEKRLKTEIEWPCFIYHVFVIVEQNSKKPDKYDINKNFRSVKSFGVQDRNKVL